MRKTYLLDYISLDMLRVFPSAMTVNKIDSWYFCSQVDNDMTLVNALRSESAVKVVNDICEKKFKVNKRKVKVNPGEVMLVISVSRRLPKEYTLDDLARLIDKGKISFYEVIV